MKFFAILTAGRRVSIDSERPITKVLVGHRDEVREQPAGWAKKVEERTDEEKLAALAFAMQRRNGRYALKALDWLTDEDSVETAVARFPGPEWINVEARPAYAL